MDGALPQILILEAQRARTPHTWAENLPYAFPVIGGSQDKNHLPTNETPFDQQYPRACGTGFGTALAGNTLPHD